MLDVNQNLGNYSLDHPAMFLPDIPLAKFHRVGLAIYTGYQDQKSPGLLFKDPNCIKSLNTVALCFQ